MKIWKKYILKSILEIWPFNYLYIFWVPNQSKTFEIWGLISQSESHTFKVQSDRIFQSIFKISNFCKDFQILMFNLISFAVILLKIVEQLLFKNECTLVNSTLISKVKMCPIFLSFVLDYGKEKVVHKVCFIKVHSNLILLLWLYCKFFGKLVLNIENLSC